MTARLLLANQLRSIDEVRWTVVSGDEWVDVPKELSELSLLVVPIRRELALSDITSFVQLLRLFRRERFDFVQTHTPKASLLGLPAARLSRTRAVYTIHGALFFRSNGRLANLAGWAFERWCCSWAHDVLLQSREDKKVLPRVAICPRRKLHYIGNGIVVERFTQPVDPALRATRAVVLMVSRLVREKGCADFLLLAERLGDQLDFVHVGPSEADQSDALTQGELERGRAAGVRFVGAVDDVRPYLAGADIVVLPSYREGIPRAAMEAAASAKPVVAYDVRGVREVIDPELGLLACRGDVDGLTEIVRGLAGDGGRRTELGRRCRERVVERFSEQDVLGRLRTFYSGLPSAP
jgi:glycosyltransferase involved in cell wall biosynthesis